MTRTLPTRPAVPFFALLLAGALGAAGCSSPSTPALVKEETVCAGFEQAGQKMRGGLKKPVRLRVMEDDEVVATVMLFGIADSKHPTRFLLPDTDKEYSLEFAQCANDRAPQPEEKDQKNASKAGGVKFECNEPAVYSTVRHETKKGEPASMEIPFPVPPNAECWEGPAAAPTASASAEPSAAPTASASAEPAPTAEPTASASAEPAPSASAPATPSATAKPTAKPTANPSDFSSP
jgi:hypothetical protein